MSVIVVTGSAGLVGSEAARRFAAIGFDVVGIDNNMRSAFFGTEASTEWNRCLLQSELRQQYEHHSTDIRDKAEIERIFQKYGHNIRAVIHAAAQPSHDWAATDPPVDFSVNAVGTLQMLESTRKHCPEAAFIFTSTNKVYGDTPNRLPVKELDSRWEIDPKHEYSNGITEEMTIDNSLHSVFGASKLAADVMVQEYGRYFGMNTVCFRGGCLTGPSHSGTQLHGFLAYLMKATVTRKTYTVFGYKAKQVRDNIHSADLVECFVQFVHSPHAAKVYNIGGGRQSNVSMLEAIDLCQDISGVALDWSLSDNNRIGDHIWWIGSNEKFTTDYPQWEMRHSVRDILQEIYDSNKERWLAEVRGRS